MATKDNILSQNKTKKAKKPPKIFELKYSLQEKLRDIERTKQLYERFFTINQDFLCYILSTNLTFGEYRMIMWLMAVMNEENSIIVNLPTIKKELGLTVQHICTVIRTLIRKDIIINRSQNRNAKQIGFNPTFIKLAQQVNSRWGNH